MEAGEFISTADSLPVDVKIQLIDKLLKGLNPISKEIDELWAIEAERRVEELRSGKVKPIGGEEVFKEISTKIFEMKYLFHPEAKIELNEAVL